MMSEEQQPSQDRSLSSDSQPWWFRWLQKIGCILAALSKLNYLLNISRCTLFTNIGVAYPQQFEGQATLTLVKRFLQSIPYPCNINMINNT